ncbi:MAG: type 1 periplasmic-binding domain-containing protein [Mycobacteriales bacterium]
MIKYINSQGGVDGRALTPVYDVYNPNSTASYSSQSQATCAFMTQDHHVFVHLNVVSDATFFACMEQAGTVGVESYDIGPSPNIYPGIFFGSDLSFEATGRLLGEGLPAQGFLTTSNKIGLIQEDAPVFDQAVSKGLEPALASYGLRLTQTYKVTPVGQTSDEATAVQDLNSAVLKFHTEGIDRVLFLTSYGALADTIFMKDASEQHYYPKYGLSSKDGAASLALGNAPVDQLSGSVGVGWEPYEDISTPTTAQLSPTAGSCLAILHDEGVPPPSNDGQRNGEYTYCEAFFLFVTIARAAGPTLTRSTFIAAGQALGSVYRDPLTIAGLTRFQGSGSHDGPAAWVPFAYVGACGCYRADGPVRPIPAS